MKPQAGTLYWVALIKSKRFGNAAAKTTMFVLADYVGGDDECHPGVDRVAAETELSPYQARKALAWLKEAGLIQQTRRVNGDGHRIENGLVLDRDGVLALPDVVGLDAKTAPRPSAVLRSAPSAVLGESPSANLASEIADKASQEPPIEPTAYPPTPLPALAAPTFDDWWREYPLHVGKGQALRAWPKALKLADAETLLAGAKRFAADPNRDPEYTCYGSTWLNGQRWLDEPLPAKNGTSVAARNLSTINDFFQGGNGERATSAGHPAGNGGDLAGPRDESGRDRGVVLDARSARL